MTSPSKLKGDRAELEVQRLLQDELGLPARRALGAGRRDDIGDISGVPDTCIQVAAYKDIARAIREKLPQLEQQRDRAGATYSALFCQAAWRPMDRRNDTRNVVHHDQGDDVSSHADTIRRGLSEYDPEIDSVRRQHEALDALLAENQQLREALRISYPMTPVDCFISELRETFMCAEGGTVSYLTFERHVDDLREALAGDTE